MRLIREAESWEGYQIRNTYENYVKGLKHILNVDRTHPEFMKISSKVTRYMAESEKLEEMLQQRRNLAMTADEDLQKIS